MPKPRIGVDVDGVLAPGRFIPEEMRTIEVYQALPPIAEAEVLQDMARIADVYVLTARGMASDDLQAWIYKHYALSLPCFTEMYGAKKAMFARLLELDVLFDDSPKVLENLDEECVGVLVANDHWPENAEARQHGDFEHVVEDLEEALEWLEEWKDGGKVRLEGI